MLNYLNEKLPNLKRNNVLLVRKRRTIRTNKTLKEGYVITPNGQGPQYLLLNDKRHQIQANTTRKPTR